VERVYVAITRPRGYDCVSGLPGSAKLQFVRNQQASLLRGDKTGKKRFYNTMIPVADRLYDEHIEELRREGLIR